MGRKSREIECLDRLNRMAVSMDDIMNFLVEEKVIDRNQIKTVNNSADQPKQVQLMLEELKRADKIQLLSYEWVILPVERIKVLIVTDRNQKEFSYDGA
jgi:hypothetical protein